MSTGWIIAIVVVVLAFIISNIMLLRRSKSFKYDPEKVKPLPIEDDDDWSSSASTEKAKDAQSDDTKPASKPDDH